LVFSEHFFTYYCENCGNKYVEKEYIGRGIRLEIAKICIQCQFKNNWTSGNKIIDNFIQEKQLKDDKGKNIFEWIPFNELIIIKEMEDNCSATAILKNGPLQYNEDKNRWIRRSYEKVCLKYSHNSQDVIDEFINTVFNIFL
jgi:hypothetical protein